MKFIRKNINVNFVSRVNRSEMKFGTIHRMLCVKPLSMRFAIETIVSCLIFKSKYMMI